MKDIPKRNYFSKVREAREALKADALKLRDLHMQAIEKALDLGEIEVAIKAIQWAREHMPADDDGTTAIDASIDKTVVAEKGGSSGPSITIGFALGGMPAPKALPEPKPAVNILDVTEIPENDPDTN